MPFGHDETWTELSEGGGTVFLFTVAPDGTRSLAEATWRDGRIAVRSTPLGSNGEFVMSALADVDGDGVRECVLSENNGGFLLFGQTGVSGDVDCGFRLQLEGFSAARRSVPVVWGAQDCTRSSPSRTTNTSISCRSTDPERPSLSDER
jgi:hypothetical protein